MIKCESDECFHTIPNSGLFLDWKAIFNHVMSNADTEKNIKTEGHLTQM